MNQDELQSLVQDLQTFDADSRHIEAKRARGGLPRRLWETLSAFANSDGGGVIILGVDEESGFTPVGVQNPGQVQADLASMCDQMEPPLRLPIDLFELNGAPLVVAEVPELPYTLKPCYHKAAGLTNGVYLRVADGDRRASPHEVQLLREGQGQPLHDLDPVPQGSVADLDSDLVGRFLSHLRSRPDAPWRDWDDEKILQTFKVLVEHDGQMVPSLAGWLCLASYPQEHFPQLAVAFTRYPGSRVGETGPGGERFLDNRLLEGPLPVLVRGTIDAIKRNMQRRGIVRGLYREDLWEYPEEALREAVVNALIHRDLSPGARGTKVQVRMFPDRLEVENPGGLFGPVTPERLGEPGAEASRNSQLVRLVTELVDERGQTLCESRGTGIAVMVDRLIGAGMAPPDFDDKLLQFKVRFFNHTLLSEDTIRWVADLLGRDAPDHQAKVLAWLRYSGGELDNSSYRRLTGVDSRVATKELGELVDAGVLLRVGTRRWARYRLADSNLEADRQDSLLDLVENTRGAEVVSILKSSASPLSSQEIADQLGLSRGAALYWLKKLREAGEVETTTKHPKAPGTRYKLRE